MLSIEPEIIIYSLIIITIIVALIRYDLLIRITLQSLEKLKINISGYKLDQKLGIKSQKLFKYDLAPGSEDYQATHMHILDDLFKYVQKHFPEKMTTMLDVGSGKGRPLFYGALRGLKKVIGVEINPDLHQIARKNLESFKNKHPQNRSQFVLINCDVWEYKIPDDVEIIFIFNPLKAESLSALLPQIAEKKGRIVLYTTCVYDFLFTNAGFKEVAFFQYGNNRTLTKIFLN